MFPIMEEGAVKAFRSRTQKALLGFLILSRGIVTAQQLYDNQENVTEGTYFTKPEGRVEQFTHNPGPDSINSSPRCAKFQRNRSRYDYIKLQLKQKPVELDNYASYDAAAPRLKMKIYTTAPAGSTIEIQFGSQELAAKAYPEGTHSQFQGVTNRTGGWEEVEFRYVTTPKGSMTPAKDVDQLTILFMPNTNSTHTFYFDDLEGPKLASGPSAKLWKKR